MRGRREKLGGGVGERGQGGGRKGRTAAVFALRTVRLVDLGRFTSIEGLNA